MNEMEKIRQQLNRRQFLTRTSLGLGAMALGGLLRGQSAGISAATSQSEFPQWPARVKRVVYLFQSGGPSQLDLYDYKPLLKELHGSELPESVRQGQRLTGMSGDQSSLPLTSSIFNFRQYGESGTWVSELMPYTAEVVDDLCFIKSMQTDAINHDPAITFFQSGSQLPGRPSMGAWISYGLGSLNDNLPAFIVLVSKNAGGQPLYARLWGNGFLPSRHQGVQFRSDKDAVLYMNDPQGYARSSRRDMLQSLKQLNQLQAVRKGEIGCRQGGKPRSGHLCGQLSVGKATIGKGCAFCTAFPSGVGSAWWLAQGDQASMPANGSTYCRTDQGPQAPRYAR